MTTSLQNIYKFHHKNERPEGFSIMEKERSELLKKIIGVSKKVLDIGCRDGVLTKHFVDQNQVTGIDIDDDSLTIAKNKYGIETLCMDLNGSWAELEGKKFDVIVAGEILEHLFYPDKIISRVTKHLNSDGTFVGSVPNAFSLKNRFRYLLGRKRFTPLSDPTHVNHFSHNELMNILKKYFSEVKIIGLGRYKRMSQLFPSLISFDLFFVCQYPK